MKKALIVGIDDYPSSPLNGCVNDATAIGALLEANGDGSPNFSVRLLTSNTTKITTASLHAAIVELFQGEVETCLLYFAGHGTINSQTNTGYIVTQDGRAPAWGVTLTDILNLANAAHPRVKSTVIILDSCQSGAMGEVPVAGPTSVSTIGNGVTILTACHREQSAAEHDGQGIFTSILIDSLQGGSADVRGQITPASVYAHVDQTLGAWEQRPIYKANVQTFVVLRSVSPKVALETLRRLPEFFPDAACMFALDPSYEPNRGEEAERLKDVPVVQEHVDRYRELQECHKFGLVSPVDQPHMWHAAIYSTGCKLTALGAHYRKLAQLRRI